MIDHQENKLFSINWSRLITHRDWRRKHDACTDLHQILRMYIVVFSVAFVWDSWMYQGVGLWFLCLLLGLFAFCGVTLFSLNVIIFASSFYNFLWLLTLRKLLFTNERHKGRGSRGEERWGRAWRSRGERHYIGIYCISRESIFRRTLVYWVFNLRLLSRGG